MVVSRGIIRYAPIKGSMAKNMNRIRIIPYGKLNLTYESSGSIGN